MIVDAFTFNGEYDLLEIRLNVLNDHVDQFVIVEAPTTFSGKDKPLYYEREKDRYKKWHDKIKYFVIDEDYSDDEWRLAMSSPNTKGASHWIHEFLLKESIKKALTHLKDDDVVFIGDVDELVEPIFYSNPPEKLTKYRLRVYSYWLNNRSNESFWGTISARYGDIKHECLNHLRNNHERKNTIHENGWHFTSMGGYESVKRKLSDSYTRESYWTEGVETNLEQNIKDSKDFLGRGFTYKVDESEWPPWLKENRHLFTNLLK